MLKVKGLEFDIERYRPQMEEARRRIEIARQFREPDRVPIIMQVGNSLFCKMFGVIICIYTETVKKGIECCRFSVQ